MASASLELVRSIFAAWERGDYSSADWADPEIEYVWVDGPSPGSWRGVLAMNMAWRDFASAWGEFSLDTDKYFELDEERVLVLCHFSGRGKTSGLELGQMRTSGASLFHVREGTVTRLVIWWSGDRALADLGLPPEVSSTGA